MHYFNLTWYRFLLTCSYFWLCELLAVTYSRGNIWGIQFLVHWVLSKFLPKLLFYKWQKGLEQKCSFIARNEATISRKSTRVLFLCRRHIFYSPYGRKCQAQEVLVSTNTSKCTKIWLVEELLCLICCLEISLLFHVFKKENQNRRIMSN